MCRPFLLIRYRAMQSTKENVNIHHQNIKKKKNYCRNHRAIPKTYHVKCLT